MDGTLHLLRWVLVLFPASIATSAHALDAGSSAGIDTQMRLEICLAWRGRLRGTSIHAVRDGDVSCR
jgi:hypothetical protein